MMKRKTFALISLLCVGFSMNAMAQAEKGKAVYRRSSLYTIQIVDSKMDEAAKDAVNKTFLEMPIPDKYNDHNLKERTLDVERYKVSDEEIAAAEELLTSKKKGLGSFMNKASKEADKLTGTKHVNKDAKYIAQLLKHFEQEKVANQLIAKWYNCTPKSQHCNYSLIAERGLASASVEELKAADATMRGRSKIQDNAALELIPRTFVMATKYSYLSADSVLNLIAEAATQAATSGVAGALLGGNAQLVSLGTAAASMALGAILDGYFVKTSTYLFQLEWDKPTQELFETKYWDNPAGLFQSNEFKLKYVGKTWEYAPATLKVSTKNDNDHKLIARATVRATDSSIKELQQKYEVFKTLAPLHIDGNDIVAYIGTKEGVKNSSKFDILEVVMNEDGTTKLKKIGTTSPVKDKVWNNVYGAGTVFQGEAKGAEGKGKGKDKEEESASKKEEAIKLGRTHFQGKVGKLYEGLLIKQTK